jgi:hypothetical protein
MKTIASVCILLTVGIARGRELRGVVYWDHSGLSGHSVGELGLSTKTGIVSIEYGKPFRHMFASAGCRDIGAVWSVRTEPSDGNGEELVSAACDGSVDAPVHSAWLAVRDYIKSVAEAAGYTPGFQPGRQGPLLVQMNTIKVDVYGYLTFSVTGMCLEMGKRVNRDTIVIRSSADCYFDRDLEFRVVQVKPNVWRVDSVEPIRTLPSGQLIP